MHTLKIKVTKEHIKNGVRNDNNNCPLALAFKEGIGNAVKSQICPDELKRRYVNQMPFSPRIIWSKEAIEWLTNFDKGIKVKPATFQIAFWQDGEPQPVL